MTSTRTRSEQAAIPAPSARMVPATIVTGSPLTVRLPGNTIVPARAVTGLAYPTGAAVIVFLQEPGIGVALPLT